MSKAGGLARAQTHPTLRTQDQRVGLAETQTPQIDLRRRDDTTIYNMEHDCAPKQAIWPKRRLDLQAQTQRAGLAATQTPQVGLR